MIGYGYRWVMPMDYRSQDAALLARVDPLRRFLLGGEFEEYEGFLPNGGRNPLAEWCEAHDLPAARHPPVQALAG